MESLTDEGVNYERNTSNLNEINIISVEDGDCATRETLECDNDSVIDTTFKDAKPASLYSQVEFLESQCEVIKEADVYPEVDTCPD